MSGNNEILSNLSRNITHSTPAASYSSELLISMVDFILLLDSV